MTYNDIKRHAIGVFHKVHTGQGNNVITRTEAELRLLTGEKVGQVFLVF